MEASQPNEFLNVDRLLEASQPRPRLGFIWWMAGTFLLVLLSGIMLGGQANAKPVVAALFSLIIGGGFVAMSLTSIYSVRQLRAQQRQVEQIGEMVQRRRWNDAAMGLETYLSQPARSFGLRTQALAFLAPVLARMGRFEDAIAVQTYLIEHGMIDQAGSAAVKIGRAMAMLHEDHLFDADRAISELRRSPAAGSGALALLEIYRDVKTGHPAEAIEMFEKKATEMRDQLGHRVADAYALVARAYDLLGRQEEARLAFTRATLLAPPVELLRRYSEVQKLADRYQPAPAPPEAA